MGELIPRVSAISNVFSAWKGDPDQDAVALRFVAALHFLVISKQDSELEGISPPNPNAALGARSNVLRRAIRRYEKLILEYLKSPPQTSEVGRSMAMLGGFLEVAERFGADMDVFGIGASAGLNLGFDQYYYQADSWHWGNPRSNVQFKLDWQGASPPLSSIIVHQRKACDIAPINEATEKDKLLSYIWPDQLERLKRIRRAIGYAARAKYRIDAMEAGEWLTMQLESAAMTRPRVIYHSVIGQYFTEHQKQKFGAATEIMGSKASEKSPLIWLQFRARRKQTTR